MLKVIKISKKPSNEINNNFYPSYNNIDNRNNALRNAQSGVVIIYGKPISIIVDVLSDTEIIFKLQ